MGEKKAQEKNCIKVSQKHSHFGTKSSYNSGGNIKFNKSDIVWAKITGYPWWPALVITVPGQKEVDRRSDESKSNYPWSNVHHNVKAEYRVDFIADETHAFLRKNFLLDYHSNRDRLYVEGLQFSIRKRRFFQMAVNQADQLQQVLELSKHQMYQHKKNKLQGQESMRSESGEELSEVKSQSQSNQDQQSQNQEQNQSSPQNNLTRLTKSRNNSIKSNQSLLSISNGTKMPYQSNLSQKNYNQPQILAKRQRSLKKTNLKTKIESKDIKCLNEKRKEFFVRFQVCQKNQIKGFRKGSKQKNSQVIQQIQAKVNNENAERRTSTEKPNGQTLQNQLNESLSMKTQDLFSELLIKYNLHRIDEIEQMHKNQKLIKTKDEATQSIQKDSNFIFVTTTNKMSIKSIFTQGIGKKKQSRKYATEKHQNTEQDIFKENLSVIGKLKQSDHDIISTQQKQFLVEISKRRTTRKIHATVLHILNKNHIEHIDQQVHDSIRQRCKRISSIIFDQQYTQKHKGERKSTANMKNSSKSKSSQENNFLISYKKKLEENVNFIRFFSMENWDLLSQMTSLSTQLSIEIKSFQQFLEKHCHLHMRNQEKFQDIVKQIGIENQKTAFTYLHPPIEIMEIENDSDRMSPEKMPSQGTSQFTSVEKKNQKLFLLNQVKY